jgi:hypothetical protein
VNRFYNHFIANQTSTTLDKINEAISRVGRKNKTWIEKKEYVPEAEKTMSLGRFPSERIAFVVRDGNLERLWKSLLLLLLFIYLFN